MQEIIVLLVKKFGEQAAREVARETARRLVKKAFESFSRNDKKKKR
jgi:hypothetical protein